MIHQIRTSSWIFSLDLDITFYQFRVSSIKPVNTFPWNWMIDPSENMLCYQIWLSDPDQWWDETASVVGSRRVSHNVGMKMNRVRVEKVAPGLRECTLCVLLHTSVCEKPCLRKMHAGPTMLCSMLQFFTSALKGSLNSFSSTSSSSFSSCCRPSWPAALTLPLRGPSITPFRGRPGCYSTTPMHCLHGWFLHT